MRITLAEPVTTAVFTIAFADYVADTIFDNCGPADHLRKMIAVVAAGTALYFSVKIFRFRKVQDTIVTGRPCGSVAQWSESSHGVREVLGSSPGRAMCFFLPCDIWWPVWRENAVISYFEIILMNGIIIKHPRIKY